MSIWLDEHEHSYQKVESDIEVDHLIVGAGITGITLAYLLSKKGKSVTLIDANRLMNGTTGHTTAKITAQHALIYDEFKSNIGKSNARIHYEGAVDAAKHIQSTIQELAIDCDYEKKDSILYATSDRYVQKLEQEEKAYDALNIPYEHTQIDMLSSKKALKMANQAEMHPTKYLSALVHEITRAGGTIYENTVAVNINHGEQTVVETSDGNQITCSKCVHLFSFPLLSSHFYFSRLTAERSYVIAIEPMQMIDDGMYLNPESPKTRSIRKASYKGKDVLLIGGESHKAGQGKAVSHHYLALEKFAEETFGIKQVIDRWSAQDLTTLDKLPYIGPMHDDYPNIYVSTGYRKWGMTTGTLAAMILSDLAEQKQNRYADLYDPKRFYADPSIVTFLRENLNVATHLIKGKLDGTKQSLGKLERGTGTVFKHNGQRSGAYRDDDGQLHIVDTTCTHLGCEVNWNDGDRTWDCPCHGSRFSYTGEVIEGPAEKPLQTKSFTMFDAIDVDQESSGY
ncbi:LOW QUALITY PROTEIN: Rieske [2Fe-2S] iron-sulfur protein [Geomicrobium sp. JCM 19038]|nr:LOW QUALITY PROTEIN: Rieske [2Fe-2S] iron-sulfur protein [Geomicrobium sp. JCM 19038]